MSLILHLPDSQMGIALLICHNSNTVNSSLRFLKYNFTENWFIVSVPHVFIQQHDLSLSS